jgi:hypothetical protein
MQLSVLRVKMFSAKAMGDFLTSDERTLFLSNQRSLLGSRSLPMYKFSSSIGCSIPFYDTIRSSHFLAH